jgi:hypothetical protein
MSAIEAARLFVHVTLDGSLRFTRILPSAEGGVAVAFLYDEKRAIAEFLNDGTSDLMLYNTNGVLSPLEPTDQTPQAYLKAIQAYLFGNEGR